MNRSDRLPDDRRLVRFLHGELPAEEAEALRRRLQREPEVAARLRRLEATWDALELPPPAAAPPGFAARVAARARREPGISRISRMGADDRAAFRPAWVRAAAAGALAGGLAAGAVLGWATLPEERQGPAEGSTATFDELPVEAASESIPSLAEAYWTALSGGDAEDSSTEEEAR
ncbi:MAG: hypothetical protein PVG07_00875 [Acidobacteriota bacterium]|jgi:anti-sigma factor RsiW